MESAHGRRFLGLFGSNVASQQTSNFHPIEVFQIYDTGTLKPTMPPYSTNFVVYKYPILTSLRLHLVIPFKWHGASSYSGRRLMGSRKMGSIGLWDHFYPDKKVPNFLQYLILL
jgi:hypothetical protein